MQKLFHLRLAFENNLPERLATLFEEYGPCEQIN